MDKKGIYVTELWDDIEPGAFDNLILLFGKPELDSKSISYIVSRLQKISADKYREYKKEIKDAITHTGAVYLVNNIVKELMEVRGLVNDYEYLIKYAREIIFNSSETEEIKLGIALLGITGGEPDDMKHVMELALNDEYTIYCIPTIISNFDNHEKIIWDIAKNTYGWGRINCIQYLQHTDDIAIQRWMLLEGYHNTVMYEHTSFICATCGGLSESLSVDIITNELRIAATDLINSLLIDGPAKNINNYNDAPKLLINYIKHVRKNCSMEECATIIRIMNYILDDNFEKQKRYGWNYNIKNELISIITLILNQKKLDNDFLETVKTSSNEEDIFLIANYYNIDIWELNWKKLKSNPLNPVYWSKVTAYLNDERMEIISNYMKNAFPWSSILKNSDGYSQGALQEIINGLCRFPSYGVELVLLLLRSKVDKYRDYSLQILNLWGKKYWTLKIVKELELALNKEKNKNIKDKINTIVTETRGI